jgi:CheY-like chemotaxis protein
MPDATRPQPQRAVVDPAFDGRGFSIAEELRARGCEVVMLVPFSTQGEAIKICRTLGCEWLAKPFLAADLVGRLVEAKPAKSDSGSPVRPHDAARQGAPALRFLVAEDNAVNQRYARALLERNGHSVAVADNGVECLELLADGEFDLILMDMQMPELDGLEATRRIRASEVGTDRHIPIIATTANAMRSDEDLCRAAGMDGYVSKPIRPDRLFEAIELVLAAVRT